MSMAERASSMLGWKDQVITLKDAYDRPKPDRGGDHGYRKGYWRAVYDVIEYLEAGATARQLIVWLDEELYRWRCKGTDRNPPHIVPWGKLRKAVLKAYSYKCVYCGARATQVDHIVPVSRGGSYELANLVASCRKCNFTKNTSLPSEAGMTIKREPDERLRIVETYDAKTVEVIEESDD